MAEIISNTWPCLQTHSLSTLPPQAMDLPLIRRGITGRSLTTTMEYTHTAGDEVEDLAALLADVRERFPDVEGISVSLASFL